MKKQQEEHQDTEKFRTKMK